MVCWPVRVLRDLQVVDVEDPREAAHPIEEPRQVVVSAAQSHRDRPLVVEVLLRLRSGAELGEHEVLLLGQRAEAAQHVLHVAARRQDLEQLLELDLEQRHFFAELGQLGLGGEAASDLALQLDDLGVVALALRDHLLDLELVAEQPSGKAEAEPDRDPHPPWLSF